MTALTNYRDTPRMGDDVHPTYLSIPVKGGAKIFNGSIVALSAGYAVPASSATGLICVGKAEQTIDNTGGVDGAIEVLVRQGVFKWANATAADAITIADRGAACFALDDQTVAKTDGGAARSRAGIVIQVDPDGVWVQVALS